VRVHERLELESAVEQPDQAEQNLDQAPRVACQTAATQPERIANQQQRWGCAGQRGPTGIDAVG
jgi:hypothetical protein